MPRVLIIAYYFPPIGGIGSIRLARFASLLPQHGWQSTVIAPRSTPRAPDPSPRFPEYQVIRLRSIELSQMGRRALSAVPKARLPRAVPTVFAVACEPPRTDTCSIRMRRLAGTREPWLLVFEHCVVSDSTSSTRRRTR